MSSRWLNDRRRNVTSQNGEDGVVEAIFERIGVVSRWACEFGAWDGKTFSNTWDLIENKGWFGVMIEPDAERFARLQENAAKVYGRIVAIRDAIDDENFDTVLSFTGIPPIFDLLSIDVDGKDLSIWRSLRDYRPRVVIIEVDSGFPPGVFDKAPEGSTIEEVVAFAKGIGYELALHTGNAIFVERGLAPLLDVETDRWQDLFDYSQVRPEYAA